MSAINELLLIAAGIWLGEFLAGLFGAERMGVALRDWLFRKRKK